MKSDRTKPIQKTGRASADRRALGSSVQWRRGEAATDSGVSILVVLVEPRLPVAGPRSQALRGKLLTGFEPLHYPTRVRSR